MSQVLVPPYPSNEPILPYSVNSPERADLKAELEFQMADSVEISMTIGGKEVTTGDLGQCVCPHKHGHQLGIYHKGSAEHVSMAIDAAAAAAPEWSTLPWESRAAVFLKAAELLSTKYRMVLNAATMLGQSKNALQAEIDSACELIDFWRYNVAYARELYEMQPDSGPGMWNQLEYRPLEGFVFAVTPFNFTSIAGNLPTAPALMGNTVVWKPASSSMYSAWFLMQLLREAGLPDGVINMVQGSGSSIGPSVMDHPDLAGVHFTGSTEVFQGMWSTVGANIKKYKSYPRIVGETGGKDFIVVHPSADPEAVSTAMIRGAFEYQGQKCSAASRAYLPQSIWDEIKDHFLDQVSKIRMGDITEFSVFMGAVIDESSFDNIQTYIDHAKRSPDAEVLCGGECDKSEGYFVQPTVIQAKDPHYLTMEEEIFGPVLTVYVYEDNAFEETLHLCDQTSPYALTGAIFSTDRGPIEQARRILRHAAGNFYINDKPTGAVVGQQPFGGSRASGTNDKAGSLLNMIRWVSPRTTKETFTPATEYLYPYMSDQ